jgi:hypothetical protein
MNALTESEIYEQYQAIQARGCTDVQPYQPYTGLQEIHESEAPPPARRMETPPLAIVAAKGGAVLSGVAIAGYALIQGVLAAFLWVEANAIAIGGGLVLLFAIWAIGESRKGSSSPSVSRANPQGAQNITIYVNASNGGNVEVKQQ